MAYPKTIIITAVPNRSGTDLLCRRATFQQTSKPSVHGKPVSILGESTRTVKVISMHPKKPLTVVNDQTSLLPTRKRQRLDHLTMEEKIMRRKLKNRVAAQSARDRKKMKMEELEVVVQQLEAEKAELQEENERLKNMNMFLETENQFLKTTTLTKKESSSSSQEPANSLKRELESGASLEHASLINGPLPKGQEHPLLYPWMMLFACLQMMMNPISSASLNSTVKTSSNVEANLTQLIKLLGKHDAKKLERLLKWWGPQQKNWSPSKN